MSENRAFRIGVVCSTGALPHWQAQCLRHLLGQQGIKVVGIGRSGESGSNTSPSGLRERIADRSCRTLFPLAHATEALPAECIDLLVGTADAPAPTLGTELRDRGAQAVLWLRPTDEAPTSLDLPIWRFEVEGSKLGPNGSPAIDAWMLDAEPATVRLTCDRTRHAVSATFNGIGRYGGVDVEELLQGAAWLPVAMARSWPGAHGTRDIATTAPDKNSRSGLFSLLLNWLQLEWRFAFSNGEGHEEEGEWNIGVLPQPITSLLAEGGSTNVRWLSSPSPGSHRMEPFGYHAADGQLNVLYHKGQLGEQSDVIARIRPKPDGILKRSRTMLSTTAPLAYPFVVNRPEGILVVVSYPHQQRTELFRVAQSNEALEHEGTLFERALVNPTCVEFGGRWWLFGSDPQVPDGVLWAYHAPELRGPYTPHAQNPIHVAGSGIRPAGSLFVHEGMLHRPSVNNGADGPGIIFNRVTELTPERFKEEPVRTFNGFVGSTYPDGIRTVCALGDVTLVDGLRLGADDRETAEHGRSSSRNTDDLDE